MVTLSGGAGSRWTRGAGVVKALSPFCRLAGAHRTFLEVHLAKSRRTSRLFGVRGATCDHDQLSDASAHRRAFTP